MTCEVTPGSRFSLACQDVETGLSLIIILPNYYTYFMPEIFLSIILKYSLLYFVFTKIYVISIETDMIDIYDYYMYL